jgi:hypothetical protein
MIEDAVTNANPQRRAADGYGVLSRKRQAEGETDEMVL